MQEQRQVVVVRSEKSMGVAYALLILFGQSSRGRVVARRSWLRGDRADGRYRYDLSRAHRRGWLHRIAPLRLTLRLRGRNGSDAEAVKQVARRVVAHTLFVVWSSSGHPCSITPMWAARGGCNVGSI
jgi:hypothetical protein